MNVKFLRLPGLNPSSPSCLYELLQPEKMVFTNTNLGKDGFFVPNHPTSLAAAQVVTRLLWESLAGE